MAVHKVLQGALQDRPAPRLSLQNIDAMVLFTYFHAMARNRASARFRAFREGSTLIG